VEIVMTSAATVPNDSEVRYSSPPPDQEVAGAIVASAPPAEVAAASLESVNGQGSGDGEVQLSPQPPDQALTGAVPAQQPPAPEAQTTALDTAVGAPLGLKDVDYDDALHDADLPADDAAPPAAIDLDNQAIYRVIRAVCVSDSGDDAYSAVSEDREFTTPGLAGDKRRQFGLGFGLILFTQESGHLGKVLALTKRRDPQGFASVFGPDADALLAATTQDAAADRLRPVAGHALWEQPWLDRFRAAGRLPACQAAQNEEAIEGFFRPMMPVALGLGFTTDRGLAMVFDRVVVRGLGSGLDWVVQTAGPLRTQAQRLLALDLLGFSSVAEFQASDTSLSPSGHFDARTHAALAAALRADGRVPMPTDSQLRCALLAAATGSARNRLLQLDAPTPLLTPVTVKA
jgi:hypothetical protein